MTKFNLPVTTRRATPTSTHEHQEGWRPPVLTELAFTAACTYVGEDTFYETAAQREQRLVELVRDATDRDPAGVAWFVSDLRERFMIRGASILVAAEYAKRVQELGYPKRAPQVAQVVDAACQRADEPAEVVAYWRSRYGPLPAGVRKGLARAVQRLYTEKAALKWDSKLRQVRMADVIELVHPKPQAPWQSALYRYMLDERHHGDGYTRLAEETELLTVARSHLLGRVPATERRAYLRTGGWRGLAQGGYTWERLSGWLPGGMDAEAWEAVTQSMGVFALIRNLRNFDDVGISDEAVERVIQKITSQEDVVASKVLPYRVWSAYQHAPSDTWKRALGTTLDLTSANAPRLDGALLLIDTSASMQNALSTRSKIARVDLAALQALTVARRSDNVDVVLYGASHVNLDVQVPDWRRRSVLGAVSAVNRVIGCVGHATNGHTAIAHNFDQNKHKHVVLFTDDQQTDSARLSQHVPNIITFNLGGYGAQSTWGRGRVHVAGFSDQVFRVIAELVNAPT